jgi:hypothetical protein
VSFARITKTNGDERPVDKLDHWINQLQWKENCPEQGMIDSNGLKSYGALCFQAQTFQSYALKYNLFPNAEKAEILNFVSDEKWQKELARRMILGDREAWRNWYTSVKVRNLGLPPEDLAKSVI